MTDKLWKVGLASALGVAAISALFFGTLLAPRLSPAARPEVAVPPSPPAGADDQTARIAGLAREVNRLQADLAAQKRSIEEQREVAAAPAAAVEAPSPSISDEEMHRRRVAAFTETFEAEAKDRSATEYESQVFEAVREVGGLRLQSIDCRTSICRLEFQNMGDDARERLTQLMFKALRYGTYDFMSPDRARTTSFVGMPGHPLPVANPEELERFAE